MISINTKELLQVLGDTPYDQPILLCGVHGVGKSKIIEQFYKSRDHHVITIFLAQNSDASDIAGYLIHDKTHEKAVRISPEWWPLDGKPIVVFLDELNRANPALHNVVMDLVLNRKLAGRTLPDGSRVISAINVGTNYNVEEMDPALISRFSVYEFLPTVEEWVEWAQEEGLDERIISFINQKPSVLDGDAIRKELEKYIKDDDLAKSPDRRAWHKVGNFMKKIEDPQEIHYKMVSGTIGHAGATQLREFIITLGKGGIGPNELLTQFSDTYKKKLENYTIQELIYLNREIVLWLNRTYSEFKDSGKKNVRTNLKKFIRFMMHLEHREALSELIQSLEREAPGLIQAAAEDESLLELLTSQIDKFIS